MRLGAAVSVVGTTFRNRPTDLLPFYALGMAVAAIVQVTIMLGVVFVGLYLVTTSRLATVREELGELEQPPDPEVAPEAFAEWLEEAGTVLESALTPTVGLLVVLTGLATVVVAAVAWSAISAGQLSTCLGRLRRERGLTAGIGGARRYWPSFLGLYLLEFTLWIALSIVAAMLGGFGAIALEIGSIGALIGGVVLLVSILGWVVAAILLRVTFAFAPVAVVVDDVGAVRGAKNAAGYVRYRPTEAGFYAVIAVLAFVGFGLFSSALGAIGVVAGTGIVLSLGILPALDLLKTTLYGGGRGRIDPPDPVGRSVVGQLRDGLGRSVRELVAFVRATPGAHVLAAGTLVGGFVLGWLGGGPVETVVETSISARLEDHVAPVAALEFFGNNWSVALTMAFSGVALAIPSLTLLAVNGVVIGFLGRTEAEPLELLAFVIPHGVFELPAIAIAGAVGISLGTSWWRTWRGSQSRESLADDLERALWVLVGVGLLLLVAAIIEGFVSPYYWRAFL